MFESAGADEEITSSFHTMFVYIGDASCRESVRFSYKPFTRPIIINRLDRANGFETKVTTNFWFFVFRKPKTAVDSKYRARRYTHSKGRDALRRLLYLLYSFRTSRRGICTVINGIPWNSFYYYFRSLFIKKKTRGSLVASYTP